MITSSFEAMDLAALKAARSEIQALITKREGQEAAALREEFKKRAEQAGLDVALVLGRKATRRSRPKPKYRNPENLRQTWNGKGKQPAWIRQHLEAGGALESLLI